ncbi:Hypothetical protein LBF_2889 [Leptospira biflexa serovar Patoc strain 'Patoc 1 (Ames)']|uniref:hypothetical protein n=1 Tax=Leptospira biflexa TaxID=172 RepID=UPI000165A6AA|nr:hypothetical protein [Leptospira biflexa]ABZ95364.1 Hypothetical protein LBF_2889 [Leptospira biflexa serovar Patoc strain 'Patoc 1 (Ames)']
MITKISNSIQKSIFLFLLCVLFYSSINCKLSLNNPSDPNSKSYLETVLSNLYLNAICDPRTRGSVRLGSGTYKVNPYSLILLKNGNLVVTAGVFEELAWNSRTGGIHYSYIGTPGTNMNIIMFLINGRTFQIEWLDYLGPTSATSDDANIAPIAEMSNGDIIVYTYVNGTEQGTPISGKANADAYVVARFDQKGNRIWNTYLDLPMNSFVAEKIALVADTNDLIHLFFTHSAIGANTPDSLGFQEFPTAKVATNGTTAGQQEIGWAILNSNGTASSQTYLPSISSSEISTSTLGPNNNILIGGSALDNFNGFPGHPLPNYSRMMFANLSIQNHVIQNVTYLGNTDTTFNIGEISSIVKGNDGYFASGNAAGSFGNPFHQYQYFSTGNLRNHVFLKFDWNGNLIWNQFVGSTTSNVLEFFPKITYISFFDEFRGNILSPIDGTRFTGLDALSYGNGINELQDVTFRIRSGDGRYQSVYYETNVPVTPPNPSVLVDFNVQYLNVCNGRIAKLKKYLNYPAEEGFMEVSTIPGIEEP